MSGPASASLHTCCKDWLVEEGIAVRSAPANSSVSVKVRALIAGRLDGAWPAERVASALAVSEATLRRRLAAEDTTLTELLVEARMATALTLRRAFPPALRLRTHGRSRP